jgi:hypothetical protein
MKKVLWKGAFNYSREMEIRYAYAYSGRQAKVLMMRQLANDHEVSYQVVFSMFNGDKPNFTIEKEAP